MEKEEKGECSAVDGIESDIVGEVQRKAGLERVGRQPGSWETCPKEGYPWSESRGKSAVWHLGDVCVKGGILFALPWVVRVISPGGGQSEEGLGRA